MTEALRRWLWGHAARAPVLLLLIAVVAWSSSVHPGFVRHDTPWLVVDNPLLNQGDWRSIPAILWGMDRGTRLTLGAEYLPVRDLTVLFDFAVAGPAWTWHHAHNLAWYLLSCVLFLAVLGDLFGERLRTFFGAVVFALHPTHVESVAWLASRKDVVSLALFLLAYLGWRARERWRPALWLGVIAFLGAYWAKNTAIVLPGLLPLVAVLHERKKPLSWALWRDVLPFALAAAAGLAVTLSLGDLVGMYAEPRAPDALGRLAIQGQVVRQYLGMLAWPAQLSTLYVEPTATALSSPLVQSGLGAIGLPLLLAALVRPYRPRATLGILWFFVTLLPVSQLIPIQNLIADRYLLLPSAGVVIAVAAALPDRPGVWRLGTLLTSFVAVGLLGVLTWRQNTVWHDDVSLWRRVVTWQPDEPRGWASLAGALTEAGRPSEAASVLAAGLGRLPAHPVLLQGLGATRLAQGDLAGAEEALRAALTGDPSLRKASNNLIIILQRTGRLDEAAAVGAHLVQVHPLYAEGWNTFGVTLMQKGDLAPADQALARAGELAPLDPRVPYNRGSIAWMRGERAAAIRWWEAVLRIDPDHAHAKKALAAARSAPPAGG